MFSDRGTPDGFRHMDGFSSHTYKWINESGEVFFVKYHFKTNQGIKNFIAGGPYDQAMKNLDYATEDLHNAIAKGDFPSWTWYA